MTDDERLGLRRELPSGWFRRQLLIEMAEVVARHDALSPRDLNRRRLRAYVEGLLRAWNLHVKAHSGRGRLSLAAVARLGSRRKQRGPSVEVVAITSDRDGRGGS